MNSDLETWSYFTLHKGRQVCQCCPRFIISLVNAIQQNNNNNNNEELLIKDPEQTTTAGFGTQLKSHWGSELFSGAWLLFTDGPSASEALDSSSSVCSALWYSMSAWVLCVMVMVHGPWAHGSPSTCIGMQELFRTSCGIDTHIINNWMSHKAR